MSRVGPLLCPILVGRDDLLELADRRIGEAAAGRGQLLLLAGEAGIGKTRLLDAVRRKSRATGFIDANGSLAPQDRDVPSALILDFARSARHRPEFGSLGDDLLAMRADRDADALGSRRLYVLDVVDRIAAAVERPVLLDFEDLQWADEISLEILGELARRARDLPLLLVGAYRTEELPPGSFFREWRARLLGQRLAEEARLTPLTHDQTALMTTLILDTGLPAPRDVVAAVHQRTDGIPLHIEELLGALGEDARTDGLSIREAQVPETIEDAVLARIAQLSPEAREVARAGAVIGRCFVPEVLAGIMDRPVGDLDAPLRELSDRAYLLSPGNGGLLDFRHQLLRDVLYRTVPPVELRRLHARAGEFGAALEGHSEIHASVHFERAGMRGQAFRTALAGARAASRMSGRQEAFDLYRRAIDNMPDDLPLDEQAQLYTEYSLSANAIERNDEDELASTLARERYLQLGRPLQAAERLTSLYSVSVRNGEPIARGLEILNAALAELERQPVTPERERLRGEVLSIRAFAESNASVHDAARSDVDEALRLAEATAYRELALDTELTAARIDIVEGRYREGLARGLRVARDARNAGFESVGVTGYRNLAIAAARVMDYETAELAIREGIRYADAIEQSHCRQMMATTSAFMAWADGRWAEADAIARQELVERGCRRGVLGSLDVIGLVAMGRGDVDEARRWLQESLEGGRRTDEIAFILPPLWGLIETDLIAGDPATATGRAAEALELAIATAERALLVPFVVPGVRAWLTLHRPDEAERWLDQVAGFLRGWESMAGPALAHAEGLLKLAGGSLHAAREALDAAVRGWSDRHRRWEASWAKLDQAHCLMRSNRFGEAASLLSGVRDFAEAVGSRPLIERADGLARAGRGRGSLEEPWRPLTAREFEVARLIADGLTNGEIADQLTIAPKTASAHVEHILAKLGVTRRAEIAAWTAVISGRAAVPSSAGRQGVAAARR
jgi:DNA-binding CsgD family transcriptional regulator/tetratricopeptide (TPR) repeat protein